MPVQKIEDYYAEELPLYGTGINEIPIAKKHLLKSFNDKGNRQQGLKLVLPLKPFIPPAIQND
ncbi:MAG: hypothetical protein NVS1B13_17080 [Flavisolibacter sp.]